MTHQLYGLPKVVLNVSHNPEKFLNGITSNTLDRPHNAFLDFHGKIIATFDQLKIHDDKYLIVIEEKFLDSLMQHLEKFIKLSRAVVAKEDYRVYFDLERNYPKAHDEFIIPQRKGQLVITPKVLADTISKEAFTLFRLKNDIPRHGVDYHDELLLNIDEKDYISFTKGCFLGQEFIAKVHSRSRPSWKLVVKSEDELDGTQRQPMTSKVLDKESGKTFGFVFVSNR